MAEEMCNVLIRASVPQRLVEKYLQWMRDFDSKHFEEVMFAVVVRCPTMSREEVRAMFGRLNPPLPFKAEVTKEELEQFIPGKKLVPMGGDFH